MSILRLRRYRASSSYLPPSAVRRRTCRLHRYRASSSYLPEQLHHRRNWEFHRYCARSSYLAIALVNIRAMALRGHRASSGFLPGYVPLERSICFVGSALLAVTCPSRWARFSPASYVGVAFFALASRCQENQKALVVLEKTTRQASPYPTLTFAESCAS